MDDLFTVVVVFGKDQRFRRPLTRAIRKGAQQEAASEEATISLFRHKEIFRSDVDSLMSGETAEAASPVHRLHESPTGYPLAGWSLPGPASDSSTEYHSGGEEAV